MWWNAFFLKVTIALYEEACVLVKDIKIVPYPLYFNNNNVIKSHSSITVNTITETVFIQSMAS